MTMIDGGDLFGRALANEGVEKAFVLCGGHIMPIFYGSGANGKSTFLDTLNGLLGDYSATAPSTPSRMSVRKPPSGVGSVATRTTRSRSAVQSIEPMSF